tara:strand:+ start:221 stop:559 length:339 start_codon:yes stop_codon:yes gene_type:complete
MSSYSEIINEIKQSFSEFVCTIGGEIKNSEGVISSVKTVSTSGIDTLKVLISSSITGIELTFNTIFSSEDTEEAGKEEDTEEAGKEEDTEEEGKEEDAEEAGKEEDGNANKQ